MDANLAILIGFGLIPVISLVGWFIVNHWPEPKCTGNYLGRRGFPVVMKGRSGFSFVELLFAIIILGVGMILVAAIFPVAIQQTRLTSEESLSSQISRDASNTAGQLFLGSDLKTPALLPATGTAANHTGIVMQLPSGGAAPFNALTWQAIRGNLLVDSDPRFGWTILYRRDGDRLQSATWSPFAQIYMIPTKVRNASVYQRDYAGTNGEAIKQLSGPLAELQARPISVLIASNAGGVGVDIISVSDSSIVGASGAVCEGSIIVLADDKITTPANDVGRMNGRIYKVGSQRADIGPNAWELSPGSDFKVDPGANEILGNPSPDADDIVAIGNTAAIGTSNVIASGPADAFVIGKGFEDYKNTPVNAAGYTGTAREASAFTTWIQCK